MTDSEIELFNTFVRADGFGKRNAADFPKNSAGDRNFKMLAAKIPLIEASGALQTSNIGKQATVSKETAFALLLNYMRKLNRTARAAGVDNPELAELFRMPHGNGYQKILAAGMAFHTNSEAHEAALIEYGLPADFRSVLQMLVNALQAATGDKNDAKDSQIGATANIAAEMKEMNDALRRLRGIVPNIYEDDPTKLGEWASVSHVQSPAQKKKGNEDIPKS